MCSRQSTSTSHHFSWSDMLQADYSCYGWCVRARIYCFDVCCANMEFFMFLSSENGSLVTVSDPEGELIRQELQLFCVSMLVHE